MSLHSLVCKIINVIYLSKTFHFQFEYFKILFKYCTVSLDVDQFSLVIYLDFSYSASDLNTLKFYRIQF